MSCLEAEEFFKEWEQLANMYEFKSLLYWSGGLAPVQGGRPPCIEEYSRCLLIVADAAQFKSVSIADLLPGTKNPRTRAGLLNTGLGVRPSFCTELPLCRRHHGLTTQGCRVVIESVPRFGAPITVIVETQTLAGNSCVISGANRLLH